MTRPDPRLLAPLWRQPCVPDGACAWSGDRRIITNGFTGTDALILELYIDLSAPALRDGIPERLDALPWALAVLCRAHGMFVPLRVEVIDDPGCGPCAVLRYQSDYARASIGPSSKYGAHHIDLTPWPDLTGLTPDEASRAVVAAALRGGR